ncbi:MAG: cofactor-independent phosphoglycerate mutase [Candidatus Margulisiibacteriota bacterium]|jgi:2,3-bisphosphoglycerate-independent phosphoglycerate mutase
MHVNKISGFSFDRSSVINIDNNIEPTWAKDPRIKKKFIICLGDGMADWPIPALGFKTPLEIANTPSLNKAAELGQNGIVNLIPEGYPAGSDVANLSVLGYDVKTCYTGRAPIEAASMELNIAQEEIPFRCNFVTIQNNIMVDFTAGHITNEEAFVLIKELNNYWKNMGIRFFNGVSYRHIALLNQKFLPLLTTPPHDIISKEITRFLPIGHNNEDLISIMKECNTLLLHSTVNKKRIAEGKLPATDIWLWGQGKPIQLESFASKYDLSGAMITAVDLLKGIGKLIGFSTPYIEGATGFIDTNYERKLQTALKFLEEKDLVYIHIEAPDEAGHLGDAKIKIKAIEDFSEKIIGPILQYQKQNPNVHLMILPDHATPIELRTHTQDPVPFIIYYPDIKKDFIIHYTEKEAQKSKLNFKNGIELLNYFLTA